MGKKKYTMLYLFLICLIVLSITILLDEGARQEETIKDISVIIRGKMGDNWENMKQGIEQASIDMNVNIRFVTLGEENSSKEQISTLYQEEKGGADGILIAPIDKEDLSDPIQKVNENIPVVLIESMINGNENYGAVTCDNKSLGRDLGKEVLRHGNTNKRIWLIGDKLQCSSVMDRMQGFKEYMNGTKNQFVSPSIQETDSKSILKVLKRQEVDVVIALDTEVFSNAAKAMKVYKEKAPRTDIEVYGIGSSSEIISYLENDYIVSVAVEDDFSIGYLGVKNLVNRLEGKIVESNYKIRYIITDREHMYSKESQRLLFPFIK